MKNNEKVALVTGASSGIGRAAAQTLANHGYIVYGTSRSAKGEKVSEDGASYTLLPLTLEDEKTVEAAVNKIAKAHGRLDVLVNAAGSGIAGAIEETTAAEAREQFDVCFFGVVTVLSHVLPLMRAQRSGTIINIGSMASCFPIPFQGMYSSVKAALLMLTATLRLELKPFGIKVCAVEPGDTRTSFTERRVFTKKTAHTVYREPLERALYEMIRSELSAYGPERCAKTILKIAQKKNPPVRVSVGLDYKLLYLLAKIMPLRIKEFVLRKMYLSKSPPENAVWTFGKQFEEK